MKITRYLFLLLAIPFSGCNGQGSSEPFVQSTVLPVSGINISIQNPKKANLEISYIDKFNDQEKIYYGIDGDTTISIKENFVPLNIRYADKNIMFPLMAGDSLRFVPTANNNWTWHLLKGKKLEFDTLFFNFADKRLAREYAEQKQNYAKFYPKGVDLSKPYVVKSESLSKDTILYGRHYDQARKINRLEWALLDSLERKAKISDTYRNVYGAVINAKCVNDIIQCYNQTKSKRFYDVLLSDSSLFQPSYLEYDAGQYKNMLSNYLQSIIAKGKFHKYGSNAITIDYKEAFDSAKLYFQGPILDYILFTCLKQLQEQSSQEVFQPYLDRFRNVMRDSRYISYLESYNAGKKIAPQKPDLLLNIGGYQDETVQSLISKYEGNIIYIDLWASWCVPCLQEMPASKELVKAYASKPIKFVYLSIDDNIGKWEKAIKGLQLSQYKDSYVFNSPKTSAFLRKLKVNSIPRYIIIDKQGKIKKTNAPAPGTKEVRDIFDQLLK